MNAGGEMDSRRWMDLDGEWVYSATPRRYPDPRLNYSTLPGRDYETYRKAQDMPKRPDDERGQYGTVPGRFVDRRHFQDQSPHRLLSTYRLPQGSVLQDFTNWTSTLPPGARGPKMIKRNQKNPTKGNREEIMERVIKNDIEQERKRRKLFREEMSGTVEFSHSGTRRGRGKEIEYNTIYGGWEPDYIMEQSAKIVKNDDWEPLAQPPKALQGQFLTQPPKMVLKPLQSQPYKANSINRNLVAPIQEKRRWWFKSPKPPKLTVSNLAVIGNTQERSNKIYIEHDSLTKYSTHKQQGSKENELQQRKRRVPPPYISPPSYYSQHHTMPIKKGKPMYSEGSNPNIPAEMVSLDNKEKYQQDTECYSKYSLQYMRNSKLNLPSVKEDVEESKKTCQNIIWDRRLPQTYSILERLRSQWQGQQPSPEAGEYQDHIYEIVEGVGSPVNPHAPDFLQHKALSDSGFQIGERIYGSLLHPQKEDAPKQYMLTTSGIKEHQRENEVMKISKRNKHSASGEQRYTSPYDVQRPPIPSHGVKLPRELGFSYTSGKVQQTDKRHGAIHMRSEELDNEEHSTERRRPLRVISIKEARSKENATSNSSKGVYGGYSHTLPWKKDIHDHMKATMHSVTDAVHGRKQRISSPDTKVPTWREPVKISTLPSRGHHQGRWKHHDKLNQSVKYNVTEPSKICNDVATKKSHLLLTVPEKLQTHSTKQTEGLFVIDATCVVVKAEYIFPPKMQQVKVFPYSKTLQKPTKSDMLSMQQYFADNNRERKTSHFSSNMKTAFTNTEKKNSSSTNINSTTQNFDRLSNERQILNLKERAMRILGLSASELDLLHEARGQHEMIEKEAVNTTQVQKDMEELQVEASNDCGKRNAVEHDKLEKSSYILGLVVENVSEFSAASGSGCMEKCTSVHSNSIGDKNDFQSDHNMIMCTIKEVNTEKSYHETLNTEKQSLEDITETTIPDAEDEQNISQNDLTITNNDVIACLVNQYDEDASDCKNGHLAMDENLMQGLKSVPINKYKTNRETKNHLPLTQPTEVCRAGAESKEECVAKVSTKSYSLNENSCEKIRELQMNVQHQPQSPSQMNKGKSVGFSQKSIQLIESIESELPSTAESCKEMVSTEQRYSAKFLVKPYVRKQNYFAKDLREAVSRIRRHTAPDSDTDEELERPLSDCGSGLDDMIVEEEPVTSHSSDTSDSEVTVILCEGEKEEQEYMFEHSDSPHDATETVNRLSHKLPEESSIHNDNCELNEHPQALNNSVEESLDLNSCIEEILQDLNRTEEEFFSSSAEASSAS